MIILSEVTDNLQVVLAGTVDTNQLQCFASWREIGVSTYQAGRTAAVTNDTTDVNIVTSPAADKQKVVDLVNIYNADAVQRLVTVKLDANGTEYILWRGYVDPEQTLTYVEGAGWSVGGGYRSIKSFTVHGDAGANWVLTNATQAERFAGNSYRTVFGVDLDGYTQVRLRANQQVTSASPNTPELVVRYAGAFGAVYSSYVQLGLASELAISLVGVGYKDTGWVDMDMGARADARFIAFIERGGDAVADPAFGAVDILFR